MSPIELLTVGRVSVDLYSPEVGLGWNEASGFTKAVGGSPTNVAVAAARLGHHSAVLTKVGSDPFGAYIRARLNELGVDTRYVGVHPSLKTPLAFSVLAPPEDPPLVFYREPQAPDLTISSSDVDEESLEQVPVFWVTGTGVSAEPSAAATLDMLNRRRRRSHTVVDLDYRPMFWPSRDAATEGIGALLEYATVAVGNTMECSVAVGTNDPDDAASRILDRGVNLAIVKMGGDGVLVASSAGRVRIPPQRVKVVCALGAGDAFGGALVHGLLSGWEPEVIVRFANAAGAIVASRLLCSDAMPTINEIKALLEETNDNG